VEVEAEAEAEEARQPLEVDRRQVAATREAGRTSEAGFQRSAEAAWNSVRKV
jgi:hypothetical protein